MHPETQNVMDLSKVLHEIEQREFNWIYNSTQNITNMPYEPKVQQDIQGRVKGLVQGVLVVYLFAIFDEYTTNKILQDHLLEEELTRLRAFRHIRHSVAHRLGTRARDCRDEFENIMNSANSISGIKWDAENLKLSNSNVAFDCLNFMKGIAQQLIARLAKG